MTKGMGQSKRQKEKWDRGQRRRETEKEDGRRTQIR